MAWIFGIVAPAAYLVMAISGFVGALVIALSGTWGA